MSFSAIQVNVKYEKSKTKTKKKDLAFSNRGHLQSAGWCRAGKLSTAKNNKSFKLLEMHLFAQEKWHGTGHWLGNIKEVSCQFLQISCCFFLFLSAPSKSERYLCSVPRTQSLYLFIQLSWAKWHCLCSAPQSPSIHLSIYLGIYSII